MKPWLPPVVLLSVLGALTYICAGQAGPVIEGDLIARTRAALEPLPVQQLAVSARGLSVTLSGESSSDASVMQAAESARAVYGVAEVNNAITVAPPVAHLSPAAAACQAEFSTLLDKEPVRFYPSSAAIQPISEPVLKALAAAAGKCPSAFFEITGFPDADGPGAANLAISKLRAEAVKQSLARQGVPATRMTARGGVTNSRLDMLVQ